jgi:pimeloyl-ACP methyl ester carboxylesterase
VEHQKIATNGIQLHAVSQGEGSLILMLHGFPEFWYSWRHQIPALAADHKVVALDLRGYNESDKPTGLAAYCISELVEDVRGVIRALGYASCTLIGHDWGGAISWKVAQAYPELIDRLIVLNFPHPARFAAGLRTPQQLVRSWYIFFFQLPFLPEKLLQAFHYQMIATILQGTAIDKSSFSKADLDVYRQAAAKPGALTAMLNYYRANLRQAGGLADDGDVLEMPTLLIWGEADLALGKELTYGTEAYVRNLTLRYIPQCSHWVQQECPDLVNQFIREFIDQS